MSIYPPSILDRKQPPFFVCIPLMFPPFHRLEPFGGFTTAPVETRAGHLDRPHSQSIYRSLQEGFFDWRPKTPETYFNSKALPLNLANKSLYGANLLLGDGLMVRGNSLLSTSPSGLSRVTGCRFTVFGLSTKGVGSSSPSQSF
jgi:hypothetical protein